MVWFDAADLVRRRVSASRETDAWRGVFLCVHGCVSQCVFFTFPFRCFCTSGYTTCDNQWDDAGFTPMVVGTRLFWPCR